MPVYEYVCASGHTMEELRAVDLRSVPARCTICGLSAEKRILHAPRVFSDFSGYESPASGRWIEGRRQRREDFARTGTRAMEEGEGRDAAARQAAATAAEEAFIDHAIDTTASELGLRTS